MALALNFNHIDMSALNIPFRKANSTTTMRNIKSKKCLFGPSNPEETNQMVKENFAIERERFYKRFGIHMEDLDRIAIDKEDYLKSKCLQSTTQIPYENQFNAGGKITRKSFRMKRALKPYNANVDNQQASQSAHQQLQQQMKITDFCQVKKSPTPSTTKTTTQDKEMILQQGL